LTSDRAKLEMAAGLNVEAPEFLAWEKVVREEQYRIHSVASDQVTMQAIHAGGGVHGGYITRQKLNINCLQSGRLWD
jgi:hypothetical protein